MYVSAMSMRLLRGRSTPAKRAIRLTLPLLVSLVFADDPHDPAPADHLALVANLLDRCPDFHRTLPISRKAAENICKPMPCPFDPRPSPSPSFMVSTAQSVPRR